MTKSDSAHIEWISFASVISSIAVIFLHVNGVFWNFSSTEKYWFSANIIECIFYFAVPIFFMISGATLLDFYERYTLTIYFKKRITKTVIPYVVWSLLGLGYQIFVSGKIALADVNISFIIDGLINGTLVGIYWFFPSLFCVYLALPLFAAVPRGNKEKVFLYLSISTILLNVIVPFFEKVFSWSVHIPYILGITNGYLMYLPLGYLLAHSNIKKIVRRFIYILALAGLFLHICGTYILSIQADEIVNTYKGYTNLPCVFYSIGIFVFIRYELSKSLKFEFFKKIINYLGNYTFGLYLLHIYVLWSYTSIFHPDDKSLLYRLTSPFIILIICTILISVLRKFPGVKKILP